MYTEAREWRSGAFLRLMLAVPWLNILIGAMREKLVLLLLEAGGQRRFCRLRPGLQCPSVPRLPQTKDLKLETRVEPRYHVP